MLKPREAAQEYARFCAPLRRFIQLLRKQNLRLPELRHLKRAGKNANDVCLLIVDLKSAANHTRIAAKARPPQRVNDQGHSWPMWKIVLSRKITSEKWRNAQSPE